MSWSSFFHGLAGGYIGGFIATHAIHILRRDFYWTWIDNIMLAAWFIAVGYLGLACS
jgi:hypothetical protein